MGSGMSVITLPLLLVALSSFVTWLICRWWYGRSAERKTEDEQRPELPTNRISASSPDAEPGDVLRVASLGGAPVRPFLDTAPLTHEEPDPKDGL
jgi:hypothetical protein